MELSRAILSAPVFINYGNRPCKITKLCLSVWKGRTMYKNSCILTALRVLVNPLNENKNILIWILMGQTIKHKVIHLTAEFLSYDFYFVINTCRYQELKAQQRKGDSLQVSTSISQRPTGLKVFRQNFIDSNLFLNRALRTNQNPAITKMMVRSLTVWQTNRKYQDTQHSKSLPKTNASSICFKGPKRKSQRKMEAMRMKFQKNHPVRSHLKSLFCALYCEAVTAHVVIKWTGLSRTTTLTFIIQVSNSWAFFEKQTRSNFPFE